MSHPADEVRRRACEHLAAHPRPEHRSVLLPALDDPSQAVVLAAIRALGALGRLDDPRPLRKTLGSKDEQVALEAASALARLGDPTGRPALERLTYSEDPKIRAANRRRDRRLGDPSLAGALVRMLDDHRVGVARAALVNLPKVVGRDVAEPSDGASLGTTEQIRRWKQWYAEKGEMPTTLRGAEAARSIYRLWSSKRPLMPWLLPWRPKSCAIKSPGCWELLPLLALLPPLESANRPTVDEAPSVVPLEPWFCPTPPP